MERMMSSIEAKRNLHEARISQLERHIIDIYKRLGVLQSEQRTKVPILDTSFNRQPDISIIVARAKQPASVQAITVGAWRGQVLRR